MTIAQQLAGNNFKYSGGSNATWSGGSTAGMSMAAAGAIGSVASAIGSAYLSSVNQDIQEIQAKTAAKIAEVQGKFDALQLTKQYNKNAGHDAVMASFQNRSGGSVSAMASAAQNQLDWDIRFNNISTSIKKSGYQSQAEQFNIASSQALIGGSLGAISSGGIDYGTSLYAIGGSTKDKEA